MVATSLPGAAGSDIGARHRAARSYSILTSWLAAATQRSDVTL